MKKLVVVFFVFVMSTFSVFANESTNDLTPSEKEKKEIRTKIVKLLNKVDFTLKKDLHLEVSILVNKKGELIILSTNSDNLKANNFVKRKLNYKKVVDKPTKQYMTYKMPLVLKIKKKN